MKYIISAAGIVMLIGVLYIMGPEAFLLCLCLIAAGVGFEDRMKRNNP